MAKKYSVTIKWGQEGANSGTYDFSSQKELDAFMQGVDEGVGWMEYDIDEGKGAEESVSPMASTQRRLARISESLGATKRKKGAKFDDPSYERGFEMGYQHFADLVGETPEIQKKLAGNFTAAHKLMNKEKDVLDDFWEHFSKRVP